MEISLHTIKYKLINISLHVCSGFVEHTLCVFVCDLTKQKDSVTTQSMLSSLSGLGCAALLEHILASTSGKVSYEDNFKLPFFLA